MRTITAMEPGVLMTLVTCENVNELIAKSLKTTRVYICKKERKKKCSLLSICHNHRCQTCRIEYLQQIRE